MPYANREDKRAWSKEHSPDYYKRSEKERWIFSCAKQRCNNLNHKSYRNYGGRGIKVLYRSYAEFIIDVGRRPEGLTLDRINNNGNYEIGNCRWTDRSTQNRNRRWGSNRRVRLA